MPLGRKKVLPCILLCCCTNYGSVYVPSRCQQKAAENNLVFINRRTEGSCGYNSHILRRSYHAREKERKRALKKRMSRRKESVRMQRHWAPFFSHLNFEKEQNRAKQKGTLRRRKAAARCSWLCCYRIGLLFFTVTCPASDRWHNTSQEDLRDSLQEHIHLRPNLSRTSFISSHQLLPSPPPIQSIQCQSSLTFFTWRLTSLHTAQRHIFPPLSLSLSLTVPLSVCFVMRGSVIENHSLCRGKGEICKSLMSQ